jgi:hypothetical protein
MTYDVNIVHTKVVDLNMIYNFLVDYFFYLRLFRGSIFCFNSIVTKFNVLNFFHNII